MIVRSDNGVDVDLGLCTKIELRTQNEESPCILATTLRGQIWLLNSGPLDDMRGVFTAYAAGVAGLDIEVDWWGHTPVE